MYESDFHIYWGTHVIRVGTIDIQKETTTQIYFAESKNAFVFLLKLIIYS